jgi:hypothetical protein
MPAATVDAYLKSLPADRRNAISAVRDAVNAKLPIGYEEKIQYGMISWCVPESVLPAKDVYNKQPLCLASLGSQKNHMALYMLGVYGDENERKWFEAAYKKAGKKLDMGKSCLRFRSLDALALDVVSEAMSHVTVDKYVAAYRAIRSAMKPAQKPAAKTAAKTAAAKTAKKTAKPNSRSAKKPAKKK